MNLPRWAVTRPVTVSIIVLGFLLFGILSLGRLGVELLPRFAFPYATVATLYPGADPRTVEQAVTEPVEAAIATVGGVRNVESLSLENASVVIVEFQWGTDLGQALDEVRARLDAVQLALPREAQPPIVLPVDPAQLPLMFISLHGPDELALTDLALQVVRPRLEQIPGIGQAAVLGGLQREIHVVYDSERLRENGVSPAFLQQVIGLQSLVVPAGTVEADGVRYVARVGRPLDSAEAVAALVVGESKAPRETYGLGALVPSVLTVGDLADVRLVSQPRTGTVRVNGAPAVVLRVVGQTGASAVAVSKAARQALRELEAAYPDVAVRVLYDQADIIISSLSNVARDGAIGAFAAAAVLWAFIGNFRALLIIACAIPLSAVIALGGMYAGGLSLNVMSLGGLAVGAGMLVDNAIVVLENIYRHRREGRQPDEAAVEGTKEVLAAVTSSTLTTLAVFSPMLFLEGLAAALFRDVGITVSIALAASLLVALVVVPVLARRLLGGTLTLRRNERWWMALAETYKSLLARALRHRRIVLIATALGCLVTLPLWARLGREFLPPSRDGIVHVQLVAPAGTPEEETLRRVLPFEEAVAALPETRDILLQSGDAGVGDLFSVIGGSRADTALVTVTFRAGEERSTRKEYMRTLREIASSLPGIEMHVIPDRNFGAVGDVFTPQVIVRIAGPDPGQLRRLARAIVERMRAAGEFHDIVIQPREDQPELMLDVDRARSVVGGLTVGQVGLSLRQALVGERVGTARLGDRLVPIVVKSRPEETDTLQELMDFRVSSPVIVPDFPSRPVRLGSIAEAVPTEAPVAVRRWNGQRTVEIRALMEDIDLARANQFLEKTVGELDIPPGYTVTLAGMQRLVDETVEELGFALLLAVIAVYGVMAATFQSWMHPLVIMGTVPLAAWGAVISLYATGQRLGAPSLIGLTMLGGLVVNNGIVLIDYINRRRADGAPLIEAVITGSALRLRPVLMTAATTIFGLLPLAMAATPGSELQRPLAVAVAGGLAVSTLLTLVVIPCLYTSVSLWRQRPSPSASMPNSEKGTSARAIDGPTLFGCAVLIAALAVALALSNAKAVAASGNEVDLRLASELSVGSFNSPVYVLDADWETRLEETKFRFHLANALNPADQSVETLRLGLKADWFRPVSIIGYQRVRGDFFVGRIGADEARSMALESHNVLGNVETRLELSYSEGGLAAFAWNRRPADRLFADPGDGLYQLRGELRQAHDQDFVSVRSALWSKAVDSSGKPAGPDTVLVTSGSETRIGQTWLSGALGVRFDGSDVSPVLQGSVRFRPGAGSRLEIGIASATGASAHPILDVRYQAGGDRTRFTSLLRAAYRPDGTLTPSFYLAIEPEGSHAQWQLMIDDVSRFRLGINTTF